MSKNDWNKMNESDFESALIDTLSQTPPDDIIKQVNPWRRAMRFVIIGIALNVVTLNFLLLNYILPTIGIILTLLGFRTLRNENIWFKRCYSITVMKTVYLIIVYTVESTIYRNNIFESNFSWMISIIPVMLSFSLFICLWNALRTVRSKVGLTSNAAPVAALIVWYIILCFLALIQYVGIIILLCMIVAYVLILRNLFRLSRELDDAGYTIEASPVKMSDTALSVTVIAILVLLMLLGTAFGSNYPMEWQPYEVSDTKETSEIKLHLIELGFPEEILDDLTEEDLLACQGALRVVVDMNDHSLNKGRLETVYKDGEPFELMEPGYYSTIVYDVKELRITGIGVELPGKRETWKIFHHFCWVHDPGYRGTVALQLWPAYRNINNGWMSDGGEISGRLLYNSDGKVYTAPYYRLKQETYTRDTIFLGQYKSTDVFAEFSMPKDGEKHRGYLSYSILENKDGWIIDAWINYIHQTSPLQFPVLTAKQSRIQNAWNDDSAFKLIQDALQFFPTENDSGLITND